MTKDIKNKIAWLNFWAKNKSLKILLTILFIEVVTLLHQMGIVVMVVNDSIY